MKVEAPAAAVAVFQSNMPAKHKLNGDDDDDDDDDSGAAGAKRAPTDIVDDGVTVATRELSVIVSNTA